MLSRHPLAWLVALALLGFPWAGCSSDDGPGDTPGQDTALDVADDTAQDTADVGIDSDPDVAADTSDTVDDISPDAVVDTGPDAEIDVQRDTPPDVPVPDADVSIDTADAADAADTPDGADGGDVTDEDTGPPITDDRVTIAGPGFQPQFFVVEPGAVVRWTNLTDSVHTVTSIDELFDSGDIAPGDFFEHTFEQPGTFVYVDSAAEGRFAHVIVRGGPLTGDHAITIGADGYMPATLEIMTGESVVWTHDNGARQHTVGDGSTFFSGELAEGDQYVYRFDTAGTFVVTDFFDDGNRGTIIVSDPPPPADHTVSIGAAGFDPRDLTVTVGQRVRWTNDDPDNNHTATAVDGTFDSGVLTPGESFDHVFDATGALNYRDTVFGTLRGTVTITE